MPNHHDLIGDALERLTQGLAPYVESRLESVYADRWRNVATDSLRRGTTPVHDGQISWDAHALLTVMWDHWNQAFRQELSHLDRSLVSELREFRNRWAHQEELSFDDAWRVCDSVQRLLEHASVTHIAHAVAGEKHDLLRREFSRLEEEASRQAEIDRRKFWTLGVYVVCCIMVDTAILLAFGWDAWHLALFVVVVFGYLGYSLMSWQPRVFGPHECRRCRRIIYREPCPYCHDSIPAPATHAA